MPSVTVFDSRVPVRNWQPSKHFSYGFDFAVDWFWRVLGVLGTLYLMKDIVNHNFDLNGDGEVNTGDVLAFVDSDSDGTLSIGEIAYAVWLVLVAYVFLRTLLNIIRSLGPPRGELPGVRSPVPQPEKDESTNDKASTTNDDANKDKTE